MTKRNKFTPDQKAQIVPGSPVTGIATAGLCRRYNVRPQTLGDRGRKFTGAGRAGQGIPAAGIPPGQ